MTTDITNAAAALGRKGGQAKTEAKQAASRNNGKRGGRPRKTLLPEQTRLVFFRRIANGRKLEQNCYLTNLSAWDNIST